MREENLELLLIISTVLLLFATSFAAYNRGVIDTYRETNQHGR
jgi:hypothetical protein